MNSPLMRFTEVYILLTAPSPNNLTIRLSQRPYFDLKHYGMVKSINARKRLYKLLEMKEVCR